MNRENVLKVADAIEQHSIPDLGFNMALFIEPSDDDYPDRGGHKCNTVACIAGWAAVVSANGHVDVAKPGTARVARLYLDMGEIEADHLFYPPAARYWDATPTQAVAVLRHLAETGEVDWSVADTVPA